MFLKGCKKVYTSWWKFQTSNWSFSTLFDTTNQQGQKLVELVGTGSTNWVQPVKGVVIFLSSSTKA